MKLFTLFLFLFPVLSFAVASEQQSYIDYLKSKMEEKGKPTTDSSVGFTENVKKKLEAETPKSSDSYIETIKNSEHFKKEDEKEQKYSGSFIEAEKVKLEPKVEGGAIQAVSEGRSELHEKRDETIHHAFGLRYGAVLNRSFSAASSVQAREFKDVYGGNYAPDGALFYEYQPWHSEWYGNIGIVGMGGVGYFSGYGQFDFAIPIPGSTTGQTYPLQSKVKFQFFTIPVTLGVNYRMNVLRYLRPYVMAGLSLVGLIESRNDNISGTRAVSKGYVLSAGVSVLMDWISRPDSWAMYSNYSIKHYYLTVDFSRYATFAGIVNYGVYGLTAGITFEY